MNDDKPKDKIEERQQAELTEDEFYRAKLIFNVQSEPEVTMSVKMPEALRDELRDFCKNYRIDQQYFVTEALKEVLSRVKAELATKEPT